MHRCVIFNEVHVLRHDGCYKVSLAKKSFAPVWNFPDSSNDVAYFIMYRLTYFKHEKRLYLRETLVGLLINYLICHLI